MHVAVVAATYGDPWRERDLLAHRLAGALACSAEVDALIPCQQGTSVDQHGAVRLLRFAATPGARPLRQAWRRALHGQHETERFDPDPQRDLPRTLPSLVETELVAVEGGESPGLYDHLRKTSYDLVVFVGFHSPAVLGGVRALGDSRPFVVVPGASDDATLRLAIHDETFARAERVLVCSNWEQGRVAARLGEAEAGRIQNIGFVAGVNSLGRKTVPPGFDGLKYLLVVRDWYRPAEVDRLLRWADHLERQVHRDIRLRLVGPGAERVPLGLARTQSRLDVWRWVSRALALLDPRPNRLLGVETLEGFLYGTPVVVSHQGGATRDHAENGNGGLWFRSDEELSELVEALLDEDLRGALGAQGRSYAESGYADTDDFIKRVSASVFN